MNSVDEAVASRSEDKDVRAYQGVGNSLLERIRSGEFRAMGKLPPERELAELYNVGRAVIRDALVMLEVKGLIQSRQGSGIYITRQAYEPEPSVAVEPVPTQFWDNLTPAGPFELLEARQWIESQIARQAALRATPDDIAAIEEAADDHRRARLGPAKENLDFVFHMTIAKATQNPEMVGVASFIWKRRENNPLWKVLVRDNEYGVKDYWADDHARIVGAIRHRDGDAAFVAAWQHIENVKTLLLAPRESDPVELRNARKARKRV